MVRVKRRPVGGPYSRQRNTLPVAVRFCVSWYRIFVLLVLYVILVICVYRQIISGASPPSLQAISTRISDPLHRDSNAAFHASASAVSLLDEDHAERLIKLEEQLRTQQDAEFSSYRSCRWRSGNVYSSEDSCPTGTGAQVLFYNPLNEPRILCETTVPAHSHILLDQPCWQPPRLFPVIPDVTAQNLPPVHTCFGQCSPHGNEFKECDIPCRESGSPSIVDQRSIDKTDWLIEFSMEGPQYYDNLRLQKDAYKSNRFYSTTSFQSEVPLPYFSWAEYAIQSPPLRYDDAIKGAVFLARNCNSRNGREKIVKELQSTSLRVDSLSGCLHNAEPPDGVNIHDKNSVMQHYLFYLAFENQNEPDYITEKLWGPLVAGTVPVYFGAPNVKEHVPTHSIVVVDDFDSVGELAVYLQRLANSRELYEEYHAWRYQPLPPHFHAKYDLTSVHSTCRTCRWAYAKLYGLGWNHNNQSLTQLHVDRKVCLDSQGLVHKPFIEEWLTSSHTSVLSSLTMSNSSSCDALPWSGSSADVVKRQLRRTIFEQDGIIEVLIESAVDDIGDFLLRLHAPLDQASKYEEIAQGHGRLQDQHTRFTFLVRPKTGAEIRRTVDESLVEISVRSNQLPLRIRVLVEDIDTLHDGADHDENYFGKRMIEDFYSPMEGFAIV